MTDGARPAAAAILISGGGTNLQSLIDARESGKLSLDIAVVVSNVADAGGLERARAAGIETEIVENGHFADRAAFDRALAATIDDHIGQNSAATIVLAGFMRILTEEFVARYDGRILNIHPSLLPKYPGLNTHQRVLDNHDRLHGCTVHFVTAELDGGPAIIQGQLAVLADDSAATLASRVLQLEHKIYPVAAELLASGRLRYEDGKAVLDNEVLTQPIVYD